MSSMRASYSNSFQIEPEAHGGRQVTARISEDRVLPPAKRIGRKTPPPDQHLIIGFDTEYQSVEAATREDVKDGLAPAKNDVLSYQFCVHRACRTNASAEGADSSNVIGSSTSGIIIPTDGERIKLSDFIAFAVGAWLDEHPYQSAPRTIYLIGHFTRADLPAFANFSEEIREIVSSIRNTFTSVGNYIKFNVVSALGNDIEFRVMLRDTMLLAPSNAQRLQDLGEILNFEKISLHEDHAEEKRIKGNMRGLLRSNWHLFRSYAIRDAEICVAFAERILAQNLALFDEFSIPITLTSFGTSSVLKSWEDAGWNADAVLGRETLKESYYNKKLGRYQKKTSHPYVEEVHWHLDFVTAAYHGGRNEQFVFGPAVEGDWEDLDLSSAYTTAMSLIGLPLWGQLGHVSHLDEVGMIDLAFLAVEFEFPETVRYPTLPVRTEHGIIFPLKGKTTCGAPEIWLARELGANVTLRHGIRVPCDASKPIFAPFIRDCIKRRTQYAKKSFLNLFWKEVGNSTYGKTAQGLRRKRAYDLREEDMVELPESRITQPFFAAFITSYVRAVLGEILNSFPDSVHVFSVTTDGFLATPSDADRKKAMEGPLAASFADARAALVGGSDKALETKHQVVQPIGWRTRGSATLKPGLADNDNIVLQKGGLKSRLLTVEEQNSETINLFLSRNAESEITFEVGLGIRDMVRFDADFMWRVVTKSLGMEFDWKRRPHAPEDRTFMFENELHTHLFFDTKPLVSVDEFYRFRDVWEKRRKVERECLKQVSDLSKFLQAVEVGSLSPRVTRYLARENGAMKRLRRDLCRAFKNYTAGFDLSDPYITNADFAALLSAHNVPCSIADVENGKRFAFKPHMCPDIQEVRAALCALKRNHFPTLEIDTFLVAV